MAPAFFWELGYYGPLLDSTNLDIKKTPPVVVVKNHLALGLRSSKTAPALPTFVVSAEDLVNVEQSELMMPKTSWNATRHGPVGVPLPPDRQRHEESGN